MNTSHVILSWLVVQFVLVTQLDAQRKSGFSQRKRIKQSFGARYIHLIPRAEYQDVDVHANKANPYSLKSAKFEPAFALDFISNRRLKGSKLFSYEVCLSLSYIQGELFYYSRGSRTNSGPEKFLEERKQVEFKQVYFNSSYQWIYRLAKNSPVRFSFGTQISGRVYNHNYMITETILIDTRSSPFEEDKWGRNEESDKDTDFIFAQIYLCAGLGIDVELFNRKTHFGIEFSRSMLAFHNAGKLHLDLLSISASLPIHRR